jgi:hypothetical protein
MYSELLVLKGGIIWNNRSKEPTILLFKKIKINEKIIRKGNNR